MRNVDALVALKADKIPPERLGERLRGFRLPDPGGTFEQERAAELKREKDRDREPRVGQIAALRETGVEGRRRFEVGEASLGAGRQCPRSCKARKILSGVNGMVSMRTPTASKIALAMAGMGALAHISPGPLAP
jgi:hypothetical protein